MKINANAEVFMSPASHHGDLGSLPGQTMWDLGQTKSHWGRFFSDYFGFPLSNHSTAAPYSFMCHLGDGQWAR
jgi:hypothetical protein